ncbi:MAG: hypothetical protein K2X49_17515, partial [Acetobacteraceae bacterium]|nr:hypothetical protein [Acetobacteraceae bacterium]
MLSALPGPPWMLPDPVLSERLGRIMQSWAETLPRQRPAPLDLALARRLLRTFGGARRIHPGLVPA